MAPEMMMNADKITFFTVFFLYGGVASRASGIRQIINNSMNCEGCHDACARLILFRRDMFVDCLFTGI